MKKEQPVFVATMPKKPIVKLHPPPQGILQERGMTTRAVVLAPGTALFLNRDVRVPALYPHTPVIPAVLVIGPVTTVILNPLIKKFVVIPPVCRNTPI